MTPYRLAIPENYTLESKITTLILYTAKVMIILIIV